MAVIKGTKAEDVVAVLMLIPADIRWQVKEITLDMAVNMYKIARTCFPQAIGRFHVQKLVYEAVQKTTYYLSLASNQVRKQADERSTKEGN